MKDLGIVLDGGRALGFPLPLPAAAAAYGQKDVFVTRVREALTGIALPTPPEKDKP